MNSTEVNSSILSQNTKQCLHCYNTECSATRLLENGMYPIYEIDHHTRIGDNSNRSIDINSIVRNIPRDILIKIYNEYIRPHKYYQLFKILTSNTGGNQELQNIHQGEFIKHFKIFMYTPIKKYIMRIDYEFNKVMIFCSNRGYTSYFKRILNIKKAIFIELVMHKYHRK